MHSNGAGLVRGVEGKVCVVTGAGSGIGRATAMLFAQRGAKVVVADIDGQAAERVAGEIGDAARAVECDVVDEAQVAEAIRTAVDAFGGLDVIVNNAGLSWATPLIESTSEEFVRMFNVNQLGVFHGIKLAIGPMKARGGGSIVSTSSAAGLRGVFNFAHYAATKAAVISLTLTAAIELREFNIRANCICPGSTHTPLMDSVVNPLLEIGVDVNANVAAKQGRYGEPEDQARAIVYLASDEAEFVSGLVMPVDNALSASLNT